MNRAKKGFSMLDASLLEQLKVHFAALESDLVFVVAPSVHAKQAELLEMLRDVASASPRLFVHEEGAAVDSVRAELWRNGKPTGIVFRAVPGGHEFTSLVLAILNADGKGKLPDAGLQARVRSLQGPVRLRTYVSLSCTNCPDVVQALNMLATFHDDFEHVTIDGELAQEEVAALGIQGVPAVFSGDQLLHVGKSDLAELLGKLEKHLGATPVIQSTEPQEFDVVVLGGGPAGSSAAIYSARKGLKTALVAQKVGGQVRDTRGIENLISVPYTEGLRLAADLETHLLSYPISVLENRKVESVTSKDGKSIVHIEGGETLRTAALIVATGAKWRELGVPGEKEYIGRGVAFCPHCDGPFYKGKRVAVIGGGNSGVEAAIDLAGICAHVTLIEFGDTLRADQVLVDNLRKLPNTEIQVSRRTTEVVGDGQGVVALKLEDRTTGQIDELPLDGVFVQIGLMPNSGLVKELVETTRSGEIVIDIKNRTNAPGIYAAGDVSTVPYKQIVIAMGEGAKAALSAFEDRIRK
jgi:NADH-dependent peroxiredoxin subunit F